MVSKLRKRIGDKERVREGSFAEGRGGKLSRLKNEGVNRK
jgi:hypothetical protein